MDVSDAGRVNPALKRGGLRGMAAGAVVPDEDAIAQRESRDHFQRELHLARWTGGPADDAEAAAPEPFPVALL